MTEKDYSYLEKKARRQHYVTVLIERLSGKTPAEIATSLKMQVPSVERDLEYVRRNWSRIFASDEGQTRPQPPQPTVSMWRTKAVCCNCGADIAARAERVLVAVFELTNEIDVGDADYTKNGIKVSQEVGDFEGFGVASSRFLHCCEKCSPEVVDFRITNPAFVEEQLRSGQSEQHEALADDKTLGVPAPLAFPGPQSVDVNQKAIVERFLKDPRSRGLRPDMRRVGTMWVDGSNQNEIAQKLGIHQATASRMLAAVKQRAYAQS
jgi:hypothetical protein